MKNSVFSTIFLFIVFLLGLSLLLYPTISNYINNMNQNRYVNEYVEQVADLDNEVYDQMVQAARDYNATLLEKPNVFIMTDENTAEYTSLLDVSGNGILGYIEIPSIDCSLPLYHGVEESVLAIAIGHVEWSSLPVGGEGTHCVVSGHRGLPSAKLFSDLDKLQVGDLFMLQVLDETLTYEVDQILIVLPDDTDALLIEEGKDLCTLITCTPYGINSHRLLVRGHRVENQEQAKVIRVTADAMLIEPVIVAPIVAVPILFILLIYMLVTTRKKK